MKELRRKRMVITDKNDCMEVIKNKKENK